MEVNGKVYTMWGQFVEKEKEFIGGILEDSGDAMDRALFGEEGMSTEIIGITLTPNGSESAYFTIHGKDFDCGFDVQVGGIRPGDDGWVTFSGYMGHTFRIKKP